MTWLALAFGSIVVGRLSHASHFPTLAFPSVRGLVVGVNLGRDASFLVWGGFMILNLRTCVLFS